MPLQSRQFYSSS